MTRQPDRADRLIEAWRAELPDVLGPTSELTKRIMLLAGDLNEATRRELPELGLTLAEFDVIVTLLRGGAPYRMKPAALSRSLLLSTGGTSNVTAHLAERGLVEREDDPDDKRSSWVRLTAAGAALAEKAVRATTAAHADVFAGASAEVIDAATDALRELFAAVEATRPRDKSAVRAPRSSSLA